MKPLRLAVIFDQPIYSGGGYQQSLNAALLTRKLPPQLAEPIFFTTRIENISSLAEYGIDAMHLRLSRFPRLRSRLSKFIERLKFLGAASRFLSIDPFEKHLLDFDIDLVYFISPNGLARRLDRLNYITTVWDLCHRDDPEFPEVRWHREFEARESNYRAILPRATAVLVDSEHGKINVVRRYGIDAERILVMPFEAAQGSQIDDDCSTGHIDIRQKYKLDVPYVFYPAQFWAHKNHVYLLEGLKILKVEHRIEIGAIFAGYDYGNLDHVKACVEKFSLGDRIRFAGFVPNDEIPYLYRQSLALVMPTYFGPTNLPPLEAFSLNVPVLYPDKAGLRDQVGDAALLMDLTNPHTMADHLARLISDTSLRARLIKAGQAQLASYAAFNRIDVLESIIKDFRWRRACWR